MSHVNWLSKLPWLANEADHDLHVIRYDNLSLPLGMPFIGLTRPRFVETKDFYLSHRTYAAKSCRAGERFGVS